MPLTLSPSSSVTWSSSQSAPADEDMVARVDDYLPEVLAKDLEVSAPIFAEKKMTAGIPVIALPGEERTKFRSGRMSPYSPYLAASARVRSLGAIEERESMVSFIDHDDQLPVEEHETVSESASTFSHDSSDGAEPPAFRYRNSVVTTATSLASVSYRPKTSPPPESQFGCSWIDADSDGEDGRAESAEECNAGALAPRPPTPPCSEISSPVTAIHPRNDIGGSWIQKPNNLHKKSHSVSGGSPSTAIRRQMSPRSPTERVRPSTMSGPKRHVAMDSFRRSQSQTLRSPQIQTLAVPHRAQSLRTTTMDTPVSSPRFREPTLHSASLAKPPTVCEDLDGSDDELLCTASRVESLKANTVFVRTPTSPEPMRSVQSWLNSSLQPYPWTHQSEETSRAVPLPPDAIETLRVSVACFPETMLLTSSLTVETIRSYAKKMKHPLTETATVAAESPAQPPRKSLWRKVVSYKRSGSPVSDAKSPPRNTSSRHGNSIDSSSSGEIETPKPWVAISNVFANCSDYICDALYAHIVSYNYVSALVARNPVPVPSNGRASLVNLRESQQRQDDVPKKAASLLGLAASAEAAASMVRKPRRLSTPLGDWNKDGIMTSGSNAPSSQDNALRVIQSGLLHCIARLIATARLMTESGNGEERMVDMEAEDADMLFMRSLCEIVRMAEDMS